LIHKGLLLEKDNLSKTNGSDIFAVGKSYLY